MDAPVLYQSPDVVAVAKPPGVVVIPARGEDPTCLRHALEQSRGEPLWVVHRIDRDTSGVVVFARNAVAHRALSMAFEHHEVAKTYLALTRGAPLKTHGTLHTPLHVARKGRMRPAAPGEPDALASITDYAVLRRWETAVGPVCLMEARPRTGRHHQVRVHLRSMNAPLLVDPIYGCAERVTARELGLARDELACERLTLHAAALTFPVPGGTGTVTVEAPLPPDMALLVDALGDSEADPRITADVKSKPLPAPRPG